MKATVTTPGAGRHPNRTSVHDGGLRALGAVFGRTGLLSEPSFPTRPALEGSHESPAARRSLSERGVACHLAAGDACHLLPNDFGGAEARGQVRQPPPELSHAHRGS